MDINLLFYYLYGFMFFTIQNNDVLQQETRDTGPL